MPVVQNISPSIVVGATPTAEQPTQPTEQKVPAHTPKILEDQQEEIEAILEQYGQGLSLHDRLVLSAISRCESGYNQFNDNGEPLWSGYGTPDVGAFQLASVHMASASKAGFDIVNNTSDNVRYAIALYKSEGTTPWNPSKACWSKADPGW